MTVKNIVPVTRVLKPNSPITVDVGCEFLFVESAESLSVIAGGNRMSNRESGDKIKFNEPVSSFTLESSIAQTVTVVVGYGDFMRQIVTGSVFTRRSVLNLSGRAPDTRVSVSALVKPQKAGGLRSVFAGETEYLIKEPFTWYKDNKYKIDQGNLSKLVMSGSLTSGGAQSYYVVDANTGEYVSEGFYLAFGAGGSSSQNVAYFVEGGFLYAYFNYELYRGDYTNLLDSAGSGKYVQMEKIFESSTSESSISYASDVFKDGDVFYITDYQQFVVRKIDIATGVSSDINISTHKPKYLIVFDNELYFIEDGEESVIVCSKSGEFIRQFSVDLSSYIYSAIFGMSIVAGRLVLFIDAPAGKRSLIYVEPKNEPLVFTGEAVRERVSANGFFRGPRQSNSRRSLAAVDFSEAWGRMTAQGEIIKLIIDMLSETGATDNYLDRIYSVKIDGQKVIDSGDLSLAFVEIKDDFKINLPARVELVLDNTILN